MFRRRKQAPAKKLAITADDIVRADQGITNYLDGIKTLRNIDQDEMESLIQRGRAIVREWVSKGLEQWSHRD